MRTAIRCLWIGLMVLVAGCAQRKCYLVEMSPQADGMARTLTCWLEKGGQPPEIAPLPEEDLARLEKLYGVRGSPDGGAKQAFTGKFADKTPVDVGGAGSYAQYVTPFGTVGSYMERFRGNDNLQPGRERLDADLAKQRAAVDQLVDLAAGWLEQEMGRDPAFPRVRQFLDKELRQDLKSLLLYPWANNVASGLGAAGEEELMIRAIQYVIERGYLTMSDVPAVFRIELCGDAGPALALVERLLARKMGIAGGQPIPASLGFLNDPERAGKSFSAYVEKTEFFQKRLKDWKEQQKSKAKVKAAAAPRPTAAQPAPPDPRDQEPTPQSAVEDLLEEMIGDWLDFQLFSVPDRLGVKLHCGEEPIATNGTWDAEAKAVVWSAELKERRLMPMFCFAIWCRPNPAVQQKHFGSVVLEGEDLAEYAMWYCGLTKAEAQEWDRFVAGLKADGNWKQALEQFRFTSDPKPDPNSPQTEESLADEPKSLILKDEWRVKRTEEQPRPEPPGKGPRGPSPAAAPRPAPGKRAVRTPGL